MSRFRVEFYECLYARADALFELADAVLCKDGPVQTVVDLSLEAEHRRGHGALYQALNAGWAEPARLRSLLASLPVPRAVDGRIRQQGRTARGTARAAPWAGEFARASWEWKQPSAMCGVVHDRLPNR